MTKEGLYDFAKSVIDQFIECFNPKMIHIGGVNIDVDKKEMNKMNKKY